MARYRNITGDPLLVVIGNGLQRVEVDGVVDLHDDQDVQTAESGHPAPIWAPVPTTPAKKAAPAAEEADL